MDRGTHIVAVCERRFHVVIHAFLLHGHEGGVDDDAQRDKEVDKRIHDEQLDEVREPVPAAAAFPPEQQLTTLALQELLLAHALLEPEKIYDACRRTETSRVVINYYTSFFHVGLHNYFSLQSVKLLNKRT